MSCNSSYQEYNFPAIRTNESFQGATFRIVIDGEAADLTGWSAKIQFREGSPTGEAADLEPTHLDGITIDGDELTVEPVADHGLTPGDWYWDLLLTDPVGVHHVWFGGIQTVQQGVTTP